MSQEEYRKRRRDAGILQLTSRDILAATWIAQQYCISFDHLQRLLGHHAKAETKTPGKLSISATRDTISRWLTLGLVEEPRKALSGYPPHIWISRRGLTQLDLPYVYYTPRPASIRHIYAVNTVRLHLESHSLHTTWCPQRALVRETPLRPTPDAELSISKTLPTIAIQVIERPFTLDITLRDTLTTLSTLATRYTSLWYFLHAENFPAFQHALTTCPKAVTERVTLYSLDAKEVTHHE